MGMMREIKDVFFYVSTLKDSSGGGAFFYAPNVQTIAPTADGRSVLIVSGRKFFLRNAVDLRPAVEQLKNSGVTASPFLLFPIVTGALVLPPLSLKIPQIASGDMAVAPQHIVAITEDQSGPVLETETGNFLLSYQTVQKCRDALVPAGYRIISLNPL